MNAGGVVVALALAAVGGVMAAVPYPVARFSERLDAVGSTTQWTRVEPAGWKVLVTRVAGVIIVVMGLYAAYGAYAA
jgi:cytochrome c-type biogenesis protein CcmH/NrfG